MPGAGFRGSDLGRVVGLKDYECFILAAYSWGMSKALASLFAGRRRQGFKQGFSCVGSFAILCSAHHGKMLEL